MICVFFSALGINKYVIYKDDQKLIQIRAKGPIHVVYEYHRSIGHPKRHNQILVVSKLHSKGGHWNIFHFDTNLGLSGLQVNRGRTAILHNWSIRLSILNTGCLSLMAILFSWQYLMHSLDSRLSSFLTVLAYSKGIPSG